VSLACTIRSVYQRVRVFRIHAVNSTFVYSRPHPSKLTPPLVVNIFTFSSISYRIFIKVNGPQAS
jgi:hypothetical protein